MSEHRAACHCGQLQVVCVGEPSRVSVCHCLDCQRRSGTAFAAQAPFSTVNVRFSGETRDWTAVGYSGIRATFHFCPRCGSTVTYNSEALPRITAVDVGASADPLFRAPSISAFEERRHSWAIVAGEGVDHFD